MARKSAYPKLPVAAFAVATLLPAISPAGSEGYYIEPDIFGDKVVFCSEGDLWTAPVSGGVATRLTSAAGDETMPRFSPDGKWIAFTGQYAGNNDVYVVSAEGGEPRRLTFHPGGDQVVGWTPDSKYVLFNSARVNPFYERNAFKVPLDGGPTEELPVGNASLLSMDKDGKSIVFNRLFSHFRTWKRYLGGMTEDVWFGDLGTGKFRKLTTYPGHDAHPLFVGDRIYFTSERDGRMNLWSMNREGKDLEQHTKYTDFDCRIPDSDGESRIVYQHGADIYLYDTKAKKDAKIPITLPSDRRQRQPRIADATKYITDFDLSPDGKRLVATIRGDIYNLPVKAGRVVAITDTSGSREYNPTFVGEKGEKIVYWSDQTGEQNLFSRGFENATSETVLLKDPAASGVWHFPPVPSPDGNAVCFSNEVGTLMWENVTTQTLNTVDKSDVWEITSYSWSPDSRYIAYSKAEANTFGRVWIFDTKTGEKHPVSDPLFDSSNPAWDPEGKYLFYLSNRSFQPMYGGPDYETVLAPQTLPYCVILAKDGDNPFYKKDAYEEAIAEEKQKKEDEAKGKDADKKDDKKGGKKDGKDGEKKWGKEKHGDKKDKDDDKKEKKDTKIDWEGLDQRQVVFPKIQPQNIYGLSAAKDRIFYLVAPRMGEMNDDDGPPRGSKLVMFNYTADKYKEETFAPKADTYTLNRTQDKIAVRTDNTIKVEDASAGKLGDEAPSVNFASVRKYVNPPEEWKQIWTEAYRLQRDFYYTADMAGTDWKAEVDKYGALLDRIATRDELNDMLGNVIGELATGHTYVWSSGDADRGQPINSGVLGADTVAEGNRYRFTKIYRGLSWDSGAEAPLNRHGVDVKEGDYLIAINGKDVTTDHELEKYLWGLADQEVAITVNGKPTATGARTYRIKAAGGDAGLRYRDWVDANRKYVFEKTDGKVGYIHLPDMGMHGLICFFRDWFPQRKMEGMVIDERYNGGGNVSQLIIERLRRVLIGIGNVRHFKDQTYPDSVFTGKMVCLINERAGSDGDIFAQAFRDCKLGKLIGMRTWGGVCGIRADKAFIDGGMMTEPEFGWWNKEKGWDIENGGVSPDIELDNTPEDQVAGRDAQLDRGIAEVLKEMKDDPVKPWTAKKNKMDTESFRKRSKDWMDKP